jgi:hypothetical protein
MGKFNNTMEPFHGFSSLNIQTIITTDVLWWEYWKTFYSELKHFTASEHVKLKTVH